MSQDPAFCTHMTRTILCVSCGILLKSSRDDCNNYAKTAPPSIANGKVILRASERTIPEAVNFASMGYCRMALLRAAVKCPWLRWRLQVSLSWAASGDATTYTVKRFMKSVEPRRPSREVYVAHLYRQHGR